MAPSAATPVERLRLTVQGTVQGVGFRPFVFRLAARYALAGTVLNDPHGVHIEVEGPPAATAAFAEALLAEAPPLSDIRSVARVAIAPTGARAFVILPSPPGRNDAVLVPPDVATCAACLAELADPHDRRHRYPFTNCTDCGPRYTIIRAVPYDRPQTTMAGFPLCPRCRAEYEDPLCRRFHAQPNACPDCGPHVWLCDPQGGSIAAADPIAALHERLAAGQIAAIQGLGGFQLACDAHHAAAVATLRRRKGRPAKPFAVMARDVAAVEAFASPSAAERAWLTDRRRPIVLLPARPGHALAPGVSGAATSIGTMLPYTPLHELLMAGPLPVLVMTSGNRSDEPIHFEHAPALEALAGVADVFLLHNRPIYQRADDSVMRLCGEAPVLLRRARGFVPAPVALPAAGPAPVFAVGADLKNTCAVTRGDLAILGPHVGDLAQPAAEAFLAATRGHLQALFGVEPRLVVHDQHPDYVSTRFAESIAAVPRLAVQHHHAHALACLAENGHAGPALALCLDGAGYGPDGTVWGGELLRVDGLAYERAAHVAPWPLPGGDRAAREPWRMAAVALCAAFGPEDAPRHFAALPPGAAVAPALAAGVFSLIGAPAAVPHTTSAGRLFDAAAALLGLCQRMSFEGEAAMQLEALAATAPPAAPYPHALRRPAAPNAPSVLDFAPAFRRLVLDRGAGAPAAVAARAFHDTVVAAFADATRAVAAATGLDTVALSGGVFQNVLVLGGLTGALTAAGLRVLTHRQVPPNDGGLSLGQAWAGVLHLRAGG